MPQAQPIWPMIGAVAAVVVPVCALLWYLLKTEMRNQVLTLDLKVTKQFARFESRLTKVESEARPELTVRQLKELAAMPRHP